LQCTPKSPNCCTCPLNSGCLALKNGIVNELPVKTKKSKPKQRFFNYLVITDEHEQALIQKRTEKDIWHNLYEFPLIESPAELELTVDMARPFIGSAEISRISGYGFTQVNHKLTHQHLNIRFWRIIVKGRVENSVGITELKSFPFPIVIYNYIESEFLS
jgi:A/G-specific adenine glycosylase